MLPLLFALAASPASPNPDQLKDTADRVSEGHETRTGIVGLRVGLTRATGIDGEPATSFLFAGRGEELRIKGLASSHGSHSWAIGGGSGGFEGGFGLSVAVGPRVPVHRDHGPFARIGGRGGLQGNHEFYDSVLELPRTEIGWQYLRDWTALEIGGTYGALLTGRFAMTGAEPRFLGSGFASGAYAILQLPMVRLGATAQRLPAKDGAAVRTASVYGCAIGAPIALCLDARWMRGDVVFAGAPREVTSVYAGVMLGVVPPPTSADWAQGNSWAKGAGSSL